MLNRSAVGNTTRPPQPQRSYSGTPQQTIHRPNHPSRLSNVRSASGPGQFVDLTADGTDARNVEVWQQNKERVGLGGVIDITGANDDIEDGRPRKKLKIETDNALVSSPEQFGEGATAQNTVDDARTKNPGEPLDFPPRNTNKVVRGLPRRAPMDPARKSEGINPPSMATRLPPPKLVADFSPWTGLHPEDILNEQVIKTGYFDKPPGPSQNESNSARQSIWPNLSQKNNIALQTLSHLFTQALDKRQGLAKCTAPSSFKPPPRVTVTDTKREAWLKDLANTNIPLRRQSRTIPHGIRGKLLMEQCLAKSIPLQRAVWLAKCVGANELRSFRRKGVSGSAAAQGETKWIRDWTIQVEQFLESIADACGQENWRMKIDYAIKLTSAFYSEGLLDRDEYLDWLVSTFASASLNKLPLWMIITQIYWRELVKLGRRGRRLAVAILEHLHVVDGKNNAALEPLKSRLQKLVISLAITSRACLIIPIFWKKYGRYFDGEELRGPSPDSQRAVADVVQRNEILAEPLGRNVENTRSPLLGLYTLLDNVDLNVDLDKLSAECLEILPDAHDLVRAILHWSSTIHRRGHVRVYLAAKIIASLHDSGHNTDGAVLSYLQNPKSALPSEAKQVWTTIGELVRCDRFATGAYLQSIIASGAVFSSDQSNLATGLLASLPVERMPQRLRNLRMTLLARLGQANGELAAIDLAKMEIEAALSSSAEHFTDRNGTIASLSGSAQRTVGDWLCNRAFDMAQDGSMPLSAFGVVRGLLEDFGDLPSLVSLVEVTVQSDDVQLLTSITDTANMHALGFAVLGYLEGTLDRLLERHRALRGHTLDRAFLLALISLVKRCPDRTSVLKLLKSDLAAHEQQHSAVVCSPASDNLVGMQAGNLNSDAEIDAVFASGNSMDEQTMQRVFLRVIERAGKADADVAGSKSGVGRWLNQLRNVDGPGFEKLAKEYVAATVQKSPADISATSGVMALVASRCLDLDAVAGMGGQVSPKIAAVMLQILAAPRASHSLGLCEDYSFRLQQHRFSDEHPNDITSLLRKAAEDAAFCFEADWVLDVIVRIITGHPGKLLRSFTENQPSQVVQQAAARICKALLSQGQPDSTPSELDACQVIRSANALNAPFSIGWLKCHTTGQSAATVGSEQDVKNALLESVAQKSEVWPQLLAAAKPESLREIHAWARGQILAEITAGQEDLPKHDETVAGQLCEVLDVTYHSVETEDDAANLALLADKIKAQEKLLSDLSVTVADYQDKLQNIARSIHTVLHLCALSSQATATSEGAKQARVQLLAALCTLLIHPRLRTQQSIVDQVHDVAALYADALPEESLTTLSRQVVSVDIHLASLLGSSNAAASAYPNLAVASRAQPAQTQQQRALARQQQQRQATQAPSGSTARSAQQARQQPTEMKFTPFPLRNWEIMPDPTPVMGENDCAISLGLFGARRV
ncbi:hypothetical protein Q7P37_006622 [Cladosporium fusiforme]